MAKKMPVKPAAKKAPKDLVPKKNPKGGGYRYADY